MWRIAEEATSWETEARERGAVGTVVAVLMLVLIAAGALAVDVGQIYSERAQLQNAADAGALAVAQSCALSSCDDTLATSLANGNSNDNLSTPIVDSSSVAGEVTVQTTTLDGQSGAFLGKLFSTAIPDSPSVSVGATATASWYYPTKGVSILPLTFATCEFIDDGLPHKILSSGAETCKAKNPSGQEIPGGFAWLAPDDETTGCEVTAEVGEWSATSAGAATPSQCQELFDPDHDPSLKNATVAVPVFAYTCAGFTDPEFGTCKGSNVQYFIETWAGFRIEAWDFTGKYKYDPSKFGPGEKGIYGTFLGFSADPGLFSGGSTGGTGNIIVVELIK